MSTGLVDDHDVTNATLAAFGSPVPDRDLKVDIAEGYLDRGIDVLFGGGEPEPNSDQVADDAVPYWADQPENMPLPGGGVPKRSGPFTIKGTDRQFKVDWTTPEHTGTMVP